MIVFSNNMEYDSLSIEQLQGAYYASTSSSEAIFHPFKEDEGVEGLDSDKILQKENEEIENLVLKDNNLEAIKYTPEFQTNKSPTTPTNKILSSLFSKPRFAIFLRYGIAYVKDKGIQKHIMRYPQFFATQASRKKIRAKSKKRNHLAYAGKWENSPRVL